MWHTRAEMSLVVNLNDTKKRAFVRGFWKGLAAPVMLFSTSALPAEARAMDFQPLPRRPSPAASDWVRVGDNLREALRKQREAGG